MTKNEKVAAVLGTAALCSALGGLQAQAQAPDLLGDAANYIILYEGNLGHHLAINNFGTTGIWTGNIGIAGSGTLAATGPGTLNGNIDFSAPNTGQASINNTTVNGTVNFGVSRVTTDMNYLNNLSTTLSGQAGTSLAINTSSAQTVLATAGVASGGNRFFTVNSVSTGNGQNLIIRGDGTENVVFNVNTPSAAQFHGNILLQDLSGRSYGDAGYAGLTPNQVLFNLYAGSGLIGGDKLDTNNNGNYAHPANIIYGTFLDPNGAISFVNTRFVGHIYGGDSSDMQIVSGDTITSPGGSVPDAGSSALLLGMGLSLLGVARKQLLD